MNKVLRFTILQNLKSKGIKITTGILCLIILLSMPVLHLMNESGTDGMDTTIDKVLIWDESGLGLGDFKGMKSQKAYRDTEFSIASSEKEVKGNNTLLLHITKSETGYNIRYVATADGDLSEMTVLSKSADFEAEFEKLRQYSQGLTESQIKDLNTEIDQNVVWLTKDGKVPKEEDDGINMEQYNLFLGSIVIFVMLISFSAESVSSSVVTEKSNKLVENLMISVDTRALIWGKVLGALSVVGIQVLLIGICVVASAVINMLLFGMKELQLPPQVAQLVQNSGLLAVNPLSIVVALLSFLIGVLFFALLAGLFGAAISKMEDMGEGMKLFNVILVLSAYAGLATKIGGLASGDSVSIESVLSFLPFCSPFLVPVNLLTGQISLGMGCLVLLVQVVCVILLSILVTRVYRVMLLYKGDVIKLREIFKLARKGETAR